MYSIVAVCCIQYILRIYTYTCHRHIVSCFTYSCFCSSFSIISSFSSLDCEAVASKVLWKPATLGDCSAHRAQMHQTKTHSAWTYSLNIGLTPMVFLHSERIGPVFCNALNLGQRRLREACFHCFSSNESPFTTQSYYMFVDTVSHVKSMFFSSVHNGRSEGVSDTQNQFSCCACMFD